MTAFVTVSASAPAASKKELSEALVMAQRFYRQVFWGECLAAVLGRTEHWQTAVSEADHALGWYDSRFPEVA